MIYKVALAFIGTILVVAWTYKSVDKITDKSVIEVLEELGVDYSAKRPNMSILGASAEAGRSIVENGFAPKPSGGNTGQQSKHFVCISCHNTEREDPDLTVSDPEGRLSYTSDRDMPFLQATTLYGAVNRDTYYNGDYYKKYVDLVDAARNDVRGAIQLCAIECAQGRSLDDWELESILAYMWTKELQMKDLDLAATDKAIIEDVLSGNGEKQVAQLIINQKYLGGSPATFVPPPADRKVGTMHEGDSKMGMLVYRNSCLHCHEKGKYSFFQMDDHAITHRYLNRKADGYSRKSIYQVIRWGVPSKSGKRSYMPQYTSERMSDQQLADLRAYIRDRAE